MVYERYISGLKLHEANKYSLHFGDITVAMLIMD